MSNMKMDVDLLRPGTVPISPDTILWFEFLLDPNLLEKHLSKRFPDPSPTDLIVKFLSVAPDPKKLDENTDEEIPLKRCRKGLALKILSLKVAAFLKWDLSVFESSIPLTMQFQLLQELLYLAFGTDIDVAVHSEFELNADQYGIIFGLSLYHRWILRSVVYNRITTKQNRAQYIQIPGLQDPNYVAPNAIEDLVRMIENQAVVSLTVLKRILELPAPIIPTYDTFKMLTEDNADVKHYWKNGLEISDYEFHCQIHFDMARYYFLKEDYDNSREHIKEAANLYNKLKAERKELNYCSVSEGDIKGYCDALEVGPTSTHPGLLHQLYKSIRDQYTGVISVLTADNLQREIPQVYRDNLELDIQGAVSSGKFTVARDLLLQVQSLNMALRIVTGNPCFTDYIHRLRHSKKKAADMLLNALKPMLPTLNSKEMFRVKTFLLHSLDGVGASVGLKESILNSPEIKSIFSQEELQQISQFYEEEELPDMLLNSGWEIPDLSERKNSRVKIGSLEQQLILSYDHNKIRELLLQLGHINSTKPLWELNQKWDIPAPLQRAVTGLSRGFFQDFIYILLAKSKELTYKKDFQAAQQLLNVIEEEIKKNNSLNSATQYKLGRLVQWESLLIQIMQFTIEWPASGIDIEGLANNCKLCLSSLQAGESVIPRLEILEQCALCLLNLGHWDYLMSLEKRYPYFELSEAIANACHDIVKFKGGKKVCKDAWDIILPVFGPNVQQKRSSSGGSSTAHHRDSPTHCNSSNMRATLYQYFCRLREPTALSVVLSLLARLHNVLKDEPSLELNVEYAGLWPAVISNANSYAPQGVGEMLYQVLIQALRYHPNNPSWLKLVADVNFVAGHYSAAMKCYLEATILVSDFFSQQIPRNIIDDHVYRRMIICCTKLQCHTQAAVLCQFLDEPDYSTAFKCLGDVKPNSCNDAMDAYYSCIWDTTILEYLIHLHHKKGEHHRKQQAIKVIGLLELNANNNKEIQREAANIRKARFLRALARQYVC